LGTVIPSEARNLLFPLAASYLLRILLFRYLRLLLLRAALLPAFLALSLTEPRGLVNLRILLFHFRESFPRSLSAHGANGSLRFAVNLGHLCRYLLPKRRAIELQQPLDFVVGEVLVVDAHELFGNLVDVQFLLIARSEGIHKRLALVVVGNRGDEFFARLLDGVVGAVLDHVARPDQFHERADVRLFHWVNRVGLGGTSALTRCLHLVLR